MSGWTTRLVTGVAELLAAAGVGAWSPDGVYADTETGIVLRAMPQTPDRVVSLTPYPVTDNPALTDVTVGLQVRCRAGSDPRGVEDLADAAYDVLHGSTGLTLGGIPVVQVYRQSSAQLGADQLGRWERSDNYYLDANRASTHRPYE